MGWKCSMLIVTDVQEQENKQELLSHFGFENTKYIGTESFESCMNPDQGMVYIGYYKGCLVINEFEIPFTLYGEGISKKEQRIIKAFPNSDIAALSLHSVVNHWGYALIKKGEKLRARCGDADSGTSLDIGQPLDEEKDILAKSTVDEKGKRTYQFDEFPDEKMTEDQVGEDLVFELSKRFLGERIDCDDELYETEMQVFEILKGGVKKPTAQVQNQPKSKEIKANKEDSKPWWKFW